jgi:hypothetical protein
MINNSSRYKEQSKSNEKNITWTIFNKKIKKYNNPLDILIPN